MSKDIYCGIGKIPKGSKLGNMKQCAEKGQIRYYGIKKVDPQIARLSKKSSKKSNKDKTESIESLITALFRLRGKKKALLRKIDEEKNAKEKIKLTQELNILEKELGKLETNFALSQKKKKPSRLRNRSRRSRSSRRSSRRSFKKSFKKSSRRGSRRSSRSY